MMDIDEHIQEALRMARDQEIDRVSQILSVSILVGPFEDGFSIFIQGHRIGKWPTREAACDPGNRLGAALREVLRGCHAGRRP
jgi:hypothetical protein